MSDSMIERVSAALQARFRFVISESAGKPFGETRVEVPGDHVWEGYARAAIEAMRVPTEAMVKAGTIGWDALDGSPIKPMFDPSKPYDAMISAALEG